MAEKETKTVSAALEVDSELFEQFEQYQDANGMTSKSEAVRTLLRAGLNEEFDSDGDHDAPDEQPVQTSSGSPQIDIDLIRGNEPVLAGLAYLIGSDGILIASQAVAGDFWGSMIFAAIGIGIIISMIPLIVRALLKLADRTPADGDDVNVSEVQS